MKRLLFGLLLLTACSDLLGGATDDVRVATGGGSVAILPHQPSTVRFTLTNTTTAPIAVYPCGSATGAHLENLVGGTWQGYGGGVCVSNLIAPLVLQPGASVADSLVMELQGGTYRVAVPYVSATERQRTAVSPTFEARILPD